MNKIKSFFALLRELMQVNKAFKYARQIQAGKIKSRPVEELLREL